MKMEKDKVAEISMDRIEEIEEQCRQMRSDAIAKGFILLLSGQLFKDQEIKLTQATEEKGGECAA
jgi:hypothetical protein